MCPHSTCIHKIPGKGEVHSHCAIGRNPNECPICIKWKKITIFLSFYLFFLY